VERDLRAHDQPLFVEFVNTLHWYEGQPIELFANRASLNAWLAEQHLPQVASDAGLRTLRNLRRAMRLVTEALARGEPLEPKDLAVVQRALSRPAGRMVLFDPTSADPHLGIEINADPAAIVAFRAALSMATFLEAGERRRVKLCANPGCGFAFVDTSTNATRRWCYMRYCGNRLKVRAFRSRQRAEPAPAAEA
jgi:predicted RNA-binding Zn ribbon-like protein